MGLMPNHADAGVAVMIFGPLPRGIKKADIEIGAEVVP